MASERRLPHAAAVNRAASAAYSHEKVNAMPRHFARFSWFLLASSLAAGSALAQLPKGEKPAPKDPVKAPIAAPAPAPVEPKVSCTLLTPEAPRGGRLEVEGKGFGKAPVIKINGQITRIIERPGDRIAVQIPRKSDGGPVVIRVEGEDIACGTLTIIGLD
jgi:hypothetical protein